MRNDKNTPVLENAVIPYMTLLMRFKNILITSMTLPISMLCFDIKIQPHYITVVKICK
jgi:hypothetical protein